MRRNGRLTQFTQGYVVDLPLRRRCGLRSFNDTSCRVGRTVMKNKSGKMMKQSSPYLTQFRGPVRPDLLPPKHQHALLKAMQALVEKACFYYAQRWMPGVLRNRRWEVPEDAELNKWWGALLNQKIPPDSVAFSPDLNVEIPFRRLSHLRHHAVHRIRTPVDVIKRMMTDCLDVVGGLRDDLRRNKLQHLERALHSNDMDSLESAIATPLKELPMINVGPPAEVSRLATAISTSHMTTMGHLNQLPLNPPPPPARLPAVAPPPPRRQSAPENMPPPRRRSLSPTDSSARNFRQRDEVVRKPSMFSSNSRRTTIDFVDLTADSDDEATSMVSKTSYNRRLTPSNFVDLTMDE